MPLRCLHVAKEVRLRGFSILRCQIVALVWGALNRKQDSAYITEEALV
jgi:hypothetical protein